MNRIRVFVLATFFLAVTLAATRFLSWSPASAPESAAVTVPVQAAKPGVPPVPPPDLHALAGRLGGGAVPLTAEQMAEERRVEQEQVADALRSLRSGDAEERIGGIQQLAAYPTEEAEQRLAEALVKDRSAAVRAAAALSLAFVKAPRWHSLKALLGAVQDADSEVRAAALDTLEGYLNRSSPESRAFRRVYQGLAALARSGRLDRGTRKDIRERLADFSG